jgi:hypothetical protein
MTAGMIAPARPDDVIIVDGPVGASRRRRRLDTMSRSGTPVAPHVQGDARRVP